MSIIEAIVLGLVQGLTEFIPISSTAHLEIVPMLLGWGDPGAAASAVIQFGTWIAAERLEDHDRALPQDRPADGRALFVPAVDPRRRRRRLPRALQGTPSPRRPRMDVDHHLDRRRLHLRLRLDLVPDAISADAHD